MAGLVVSLLSSLSRLVHSRGVALHRSPAKRLPSPCDSQWVRAATCQTLKSMPFNHTLRSRRSERRHKCKHCVHSLVSSNLFPSLPATSRVSLAHTTLVVFSCSSPSPSLNPDFRPGPAYCRSSPVTCHDGTKISRPPAPDLGAGCRHPHAEPYPTVSPHQDGKRRGWKVADAQSNARRRWVLHRRYWDL